MSKPEFWDDAIRHLAKRDGVLARLIAAYPGMHLTRRGDPFTTLARSIVGQQISVKAAQAVWERLVVACAERGVARVDSLHLDPLRVQRKRLDSLRRAGLSANKANYIRDLARHFASARLDPATWPALDDEALIEALVEVKGIGRWTAEMFMMFHELRPNILPVDDLGLQKAAAIHYFGGERPSKDALRALGERWQPYRSVATWYLWRALDPEPVEY